MSTTRYTAPQRSMFAAVIGVRFTLKRDASDSGSAGRSPCTCRSACFAADVEAYLAQAAGKVGQGQGQVKCVCLGVCWEGRRVRVRA